TIHIWDASDGREIRAIPGHAGVITALAFDRSGWRLVTAAQDRTIKIWDTATWRSQRSFRIRTAPAWSVSFDPSGRLLAAADTGGSIAILDSTCEQEYLPLRSTTYCILKVAFRPNSNWLLSVNHDNYDHSISIWNTDLGQIIRTFHEPREKVTTAIFSPDGRL